MTIEGRARTVALSIGERLLEELRIPDAFDINGERYAARRINGTVGYALVLLALARATQDNRYERAMHEQLKRAAEVADDAPGLFDGIAGLRAVCALATAIEPRYEAFVRRCDAHLDAFLEGQDLAIESFTTYDIISGWAGIALSRSIRAGEGDDRTIARLRWFLEDESRWSCAHRFSRDGRLERNLGLAHGIPGVLASLAMSAPTVDDGLREFMMRGASFVVDAVRRESGFHEWSRVAEDAAGIACRSVWCYGAAGVGIALLSVAQRLGDSQLESFALDVLVEVSERPSAALGFGEQGMCHGTAGNAMVLFAAARCTGDQRFARGSQRLVLETLDGFEAAGDRCFTMGYDDVYYDALGALMGAAGIALALLTISGDAEPGWMRIFALPVQRC